MTILKTLPKVISKTEKYSIHICPNCLELDNKIKPKLYLYNNGTGFCFRCKEYFILEGKQKENKNNQKIFNSKVENVKLNNKQIEYFNNSLNYDSKGLLYLENRNKYLKTDYKKFKIRFTKSTILIPFYFNNELIYYQERAYPNKHYKNLSGIKVPLYISNPDLKSNSIIISEGCFDAIACSYLFPKYKSCGIIGSTMSMIQIEILKKLNPKSIIIYLDELQLSEELKKKLSKYFICPIECIHFKGYKDPEIYLKENY